jgi:hypothetical protein
MASRNIDQFIEELKVFNNDNIQGIKNDLLLHPLLSSGDHSLVSDDDQELATGIVQTKVQNSSPEDELASSNKKQAIDTTIMPAKVEYLSPDDS